LIVGELESGDLRRRLRGPGLRVRIGPIVAEVRSSFGLVESAIALHYAAHDVVAPSEFADFHVSVSPPFGPRRWIKRQSFFHFDGNVAFLPLAASQAFALLEWGLNWCISSHCHQYLIVHAAVLERNGKALVLPAPPGSGKSTLCAGLVARGWRLLSDELALLELTGDRLIPVPRPISLKNASIATIARFWPEGVMSPVVHDTIKGSVAYVRPPAPSVQRANRHAAPGWIVLPQYVKGAPTELAALSRCEAFIRLVDNAFNYNVHGRAGFDALAELVAASRCFRFSYGGDLHDAVRVFDALADEP
jgi:HprK-related kinase A